MITRRHIAYILYIAIIFLCSVVFFGDIFSWRSHSVAEFKRIHWQRTEKMKAVSEEGIGLSVVVNTPAGPARKSILLNKISLVTEKPRTTTPIVPKEAAVDTGLVRLYNKIAERKINQIFMRTIGEEGKTIPSRERTMNTTSSSTNVSSPLPLCTEFPKLVGFRDVNLTFSGHNVSEIDVEVAHDDLRRGHWEPASCTPRHKVAIIIPFRNREQHLSVLLHHLVPIWKRQLLYFRIYVVEQFGDEAFNKGRVMNAGFLEALKEDDFHCFVFHDVDLIPLNDYNLYSCPQNPRHMSVLVDELDNQYPYSA